MNKKVLIFGGLALAALSSYGAKKGFDLSTVVGGLETKLVGVRGLRVRSDHFTIKVDVSITNPSDKALDFSSGGAMTIKQLNIFDKSGKLVAKATPNLQAISIVPGGTVVLENVEVSSEYGNILNMIISGVSTNPEDYTVETIVDALGTTFTI